MINLIASGIFYVLGVATQWCWMRFKTRGQRRFWTPFLGGRGALAVVLTDKEGQSPRSPRKISITDVRAYSDVRSALSSLGREVEIRARSQADMAELTKNAFVSLGGPLANGISDAVLSRLGPHLPVKFNADEKCFEYGGAKYCSAYDESAQVVRDYGLIVRLIRLDSSRGESKAVLVAFGLHGHGTQQAVEAIIYNEELARRIHGDLKGDIFALLMFDFKDHRCVASELIKFGTIKR